MPAAELKDLMQIIDKKGEYLYKILARGVFRSKSFSEISKINQEDSYDRKNH
jgi:hypothetical protein